MSVLVMIDRKVNNGQYIEGYLTDSFDPNNNLITNANKVYQCYIPSVGKVARVPEMSRYFFFDQMKRYNPEIIYITSSRCSMFIDEDAKGDVFVKKGFEFVKTYLTEDLPLSEDLVLI